ncbi:Gly-Xaa carboxypeptidase [Boothiomyces sp. JEL0866]|nr:Gly-Xaa carboxypeptidase [Boothiomyces sp. JEL0866]
MEKLPILGGKPPQRRNYFFLISVGLLLLLIPCRILLKHYTFDGPNCHQVAPFKATKDLYLDERYRDYLVSEKYISELLDRFSGAIQIPTISYDDMTAQQPQDPVSHAPLLKLHRYFEEKYPLVHTHLEKHIVNEYSLLFVWKGKNAHLKPVMLMGHMDVVPIDPATENEWAYPPFEGHIDRENGKVWGRGTNDDKFAVVGILEAVEALLQAGFAPDQSFILAFGHDEEIGGYNGAQQIAKYLLDELMIEEYGVQAIIDEGMYMMMVGGETIFSGEQKYPLGIIGIAEKGYLDVNITVGMDKGGHASIAPAHTGIGILGQVIVDLENNPFQSDINEKNPILGQLQCMAEHTGALDTKQKFILRNWKLMKSKLFEWFDKSPKLHAAVTTSQAIDVVHGGVKANALPQLAYEVTNLRIAPHESVKSTLSHIYSAVAPIARKHNLDFVGQDFTRTKGTVGYIRVSHTGMDPSPISPVNSEQYNRIASVIRHVFGEQIIVSPGLMLANTDTKHSWDLSRSIYRFKPQFLDGTENIHTVNEHAKIEYVVGCVRFYHELIRAFNE